MDFELNNKYMEEYVHILNSKSSRLERLGLWRG